MECLDINFAGYLKNAPPTIIVKADSPRFTILHANPAYLEVTGTNARDILGLGFVEAFPENPNDSQTTENVNALKASLRETLESKSARVMEAQRYDIPIRGTTDFATHYWTATNSPILNDAGEVQYIAHVTVNITGAYELARLGERNKLEQIIEERTTLAHTLQLSEQRLQSILDTMAEGVGIIDTAGQLVYANPMAQRILGLAEDEIKKRTYGDDKWQNLKLDGSPLPDEEHPMALMMQSGQPVYDSEIGVKPPLAEPFYISINAAPIRNADGELTGGVGTFMDVTERRKLINKVISNEKRFRSLIDEAPVAIGVLAGPEFIVETVNAQILAVWGKSAAIVGQPLHIALPELQEQPFLSLLNDVYTSGNAFHGHGVKAMLEHEGELREHYFNFVYHPLLDEQGKTEGIMVVASDVTQEIHSRQQVSAALEQAQSAKMAANLGTFDWDLAKGTINWDERSRELFGIPSGQEISYESHFLARLHPDDRERVVQALADAQNRELTNGHYDVQYRISSQTESQLRWLRAFGKVSFAETGEPRRFIGSLLDITEQKMDEQRKNDFIGMVSHELRNPLTSLNGYLQMIQQRAKKSSDEFVLGIAGKAVAQSKKMTSLIHGFLNTGRLESGKLQLEQQPFIINDLIREQIDDANFRQATHHISDQACKVPITISGDRDKLGNVISNLISNAVKYTPAHTAIRVICGQEGNLLKVSVKDEGPGIRREDQARLFDRYFRGSNLNNTGGFGIGLYLCAEIITAHHGKIGVQSEPGQGSLFWFTLPLS